MNFRPAMHKLLALFLLATGCASGGATSLQGSQAVSQPASGDDMPAWVLALPEGDPPRENDETVLAAYYLALAASEDDPVRAPALYQQALDAALAGIAADSTNAQSYFQAGEAYLSLADHAAAGEMFGRAESIYPRYVMQTDYLRETAWIAAYNEGVELLLAETVDPTPAFERAHAVYQGRPEAVIQLAALYTEAERFDEALDLFQTAIEIIDGPRRERVESAETLVEWDASREVALYNIGAIGFQEERFDEAVAAYDRLNTLFPDDQAIRSNLAASLTAAGETERAQALYADLLGAPGLTAVDLLNFGIGLAQAGNDAQAAVAFAAAHAAVPESQPALYNYAQSLYFAAQADSVRAPGLWTELTGIGDALLAVDTHSRNAYQIVATALVQTGREPEASAVLDRFQSLPFAVSGTYMGELPDGVAVVGRVTNQLTAPGSEVTLRVHFYELDGSPAGTEEVTVTLGDPDVGVDFQVDLQTDDEIGGYRYEILD